MSLRPVAATFALLLVASPSFALTDEEIFRDLRFNLINPGARSLAMGGAFVSLADDATAAQANPAGLSILQAGEYFVEMRAVDNAARSSIITEDLPLGVESFVASGTDINDIVGPSFVSVVTVYERWAMGLSRQELLNIDNASLSSLAFTFDNSPGAFLAENSGNLDLNVDNINVSVGFKVNDRVHVGATLTYSQLDVRSEVVNRVVNTAGALNQPVLLEPTFDLRTSIDDGDEEVVYSLGLLYHGDAWGAGVVYRRGPSFGVVQEIEAGADVFGVAQRFPSGRFVNRFSLPDAIGLGANARWRDGLLTIAVGMERLMYSNLLDDYVAGINVLTGPDAVFDVDDATDFRAGVEYVLPRRSKLLRAIAIRGGAFAESDTTIESVSTGTPEFSTNEVFRGRDRLYHGTIGAGFVFPRVKVDAAADFSESDNEYVVSVILESGGRVP